MSIQSLNLFDRVFDAIALPNLNEEEQNNKAKEVFGKVFEKSTPHTGFSYTPTSSPKAANAAQDILSKSNQFLNQLEKDKQAFISQNTNVVDEAINDIWVQAIDFVIQKLSTQQNPSNKNKIYNLNIQLASAYEQQFNDLTDGEYFKTRSKKITESYKEWTNLYEEHINKILQNTSEQWKIEKLTQLKIKNRTEKRQFQSEDLSKLQADIKKEREQTLMSAATYYLRAFDNGPENNSRTVSEVIKKLKVGVVKIQETEQVNKLIKKIEQLSK